MERITSPNNPKIKQARALHLAKGRKQSGLLLVEGIHHVGEAVAAARQGMGVRIHSIFFSPERLKGDYARELVESEAGRGTPCYAVFDRVFETLADKDNPQGIVAVAQPRRWSLEELTPESFPWGVALASPQDPGNIGTVLRSIDAVGASGLLLLEGGTDPYHPTSVRASMGAIFWRPVVETSFARFRQWVGAHGYHLVGASAHAEMDYRQVTAYPRPLILLMGSEQKGLSAEQAASCETLLRLPMQGRVSSLNLAVATGVMLYAILEAKRGI
ncbi:MAG: RNA methyltransferase [Anaerolineales bacterium]|nr:RNA methyltransferase [Anaerolineales bacterium]